MPLHCVRRKKEAYTLAQASLSPSFLQTDLLTSDKDPYYSDGHETIKVKS